jgi:urate oxidase
MSLIEGGRGGEDAVGVLASAKYGKDKVRVFRVVRDATSKVHDVVEYNVTVLVEGAIETSYTQADNTVVVATDSMKNIVNYLAKVSPHVLYPARFGLHIAVHLLSRYAHLTTTFVTVEQLRWARIGTGAGSDSDAGGRGNKSEGHKHAFWRDGTEKRFVEVEVARKSDGDGAVARVAGGLKDLLGTLLSRFFPHPPLFHLWVFSGRLSRIHERTPPRPLNRSIADRFVS